MRYFAFILFIFSTLALADVTVPSGSSPTYSHWDFNRTNIYKLRNLYLGDSSDYTLQLKAPDTLTDDNTVFQLPGDNGTADYLLRTDGNGVTTWVDGAATLGLSSTDDVEHQSLDISGTAGAGFLELKHQSTPPDSPAGSDDLRLFVDSKKVYTKDSAGVTTEVGSGASSSGGGGINILAIGDANWDFESGDTKWTESGTSAFTADDTTADVFLGTYSGLWDAGASGEYLTGTAVTIPNALTGGTLCLLEFYYKGGDANIDFYAYDGTSAVADSTDTLAASTEWIRAYSTFTCPSSGTITLRLESSADSAPIYIDNVKIGTNDIISVPDPRWPSYEHGTDITLTSDYAGLSNISGSLIPEQDSEGNWFLSFNISASGTSDASFTVTLPATTAFDGGHAVGTDKVDGSATASGGVITVTHSTARSTTRLVGSKIPLASKPTWATKPSPDMYISGGVSADEVVAIYTSANADVLSNNSDEIMCYDTKVKDSHNAVTFTNFATQDWVFTAPSAGVYQITASALLNVTAGAWNGTAEYFAMSIKINGSETYFLDQVVPHVGNVYPGVHGSGVVYLSKNGTISIVAKHNIGSDNALFASSLHNQVAITKTPTPQEVANMIVGFNEATADRQGLVKNNVVVLSAYVDSTPANFQSVGIFKFDSKAIDTHTAYDVSTGLFTAPVDGFYRVSWVVTVSVASDSTGLQGWIKVDGAGVYAYDYYGTTLSAGKAISLGSSAILDLNAGQTVGLYTLSASVATTYSSSQECSLSIDKIGDNE